MGEIKRLVLEEDAQTTAEYALVILGAAAVASVLIAWVSKGDLIKNFFSKVFNKLTNAI
jgi:Flp pilus assembly pilin Flp